MESAVPGSRACLRRARAADDAFLFDVFSTVWEQEVAALPDPRLVGHFLRIQYTAQEERFRRRFPGHERYVVTHDGLDAGRLYLHRAPSLLHALDMTLLPKYRSRGIGTRIVEALFAEAGANDQLVSIRVARRNERASSLFASLGFRLVGADDLDRHYEWTP